MDELSLTDSELDYHVRSALKAAVRGDCEFYYQLVAVIHHRKHLVAEEVALLVTCLRALAGAVSCIDIVHHKSLVAAIFGMSLWDYSTDVMDALVELLPSLASSNGEYVDLCLEMLVANFLLPSTHPSAHFMELLEHPQFQAKKLQVLDRVHSTLKDIANLVPLSPLRLEKIVRDRMPNIYMKEPFIAMYVENILRLESGVMGQHVGSTILIALVDRLIDFDVEIAWEDILHDDFDKFIFSLEMKGLRLLVDRIYQDCNKTRDVATKLDTQMVLTFKHIRSCFESGRLVQVFMTLLHSFQKTILTAYKSKFAQFVMFYACSLDPENCGKMFANVLVDIFMSSLNPVKILKMSSVAYLASYLARAKFVSVSFVAAMLESVVSWCDLYCKNLDGEIDPEGHKVFYSAWQATMYVLCFRMRPMLAIPRLRSQLRLMHIKAIIEHPLKPLQVCLPSIVEKFLHVLKENHVFQSFLDCDLRESKHSWAFGGANRFGMFFPFDPILLKKCNSYIHRHYIYWSMVNTYGKDVGEGSSDEDVEEAYAVGCEMNISDVGNVRSFDEGNSDNDNFDYSIHKMCAIPRYSSHMFGGRTGRPVQMPAKIGLSVSP